MNAIEQCIMDISARSESLKRYYTLYAQETDPKIKADLKDILEHIARGIEADGKLFNVELNKMV